MPLVQRLWLLSMICPLSRGVTWVNLYREQKSLATSTRATLYILAKAWYCAPSQLWCFFLLNFSVNDRYSTVLKSDQWVQEAHDAVHAIRGVINFRNIEGTSIYASGQPTIDAFDAILRKVSQAHPSARAIVWIALREEPVVYVNGAPYCLVSYGAVKMIWTSIRFNAETRWVHATEYEGLRGNISISFGTSRAKT